MNLRQKNWRKMATLTTKAAASVALAMSASPAKAQFDPSTIGFLPIFINQIVRPPAAAASAPTTVVQAPQKTRELVEPIVAVVGLFSLAGLAVAIHRSPVRTEAEWNELSRTRRQRFKKAFTFGKSKEPN